ncbi:Peptidase s41 family [Mycena kentingensis (nom. inval.)]|nr:Peptidase s41 family [Mycena kentingensis (nom. inval.)]
MVRLTLLGLAFGALALAQEISNPPRQAKYESGEVHARLMAMKNARYDAVLAAGVRDTSSFRAVEGKAACVNGTAAGFRCSNIDLYHFISHADLGSTTGSGSSSWGWTFQDREFIIIAQADGAAFAEVQSDGILKYLGRLPSTPGTTPQIWRELRVLDNLVVIGTEITRHGVQIFDLTKLLNITDTPVVFDPNTDLTGFWNELPVGRTHNIVVPPSGTGKYFAAVGAQPRNDTWRAGLVFVDITDPTTPTLLGFQAEDGYVHDAQCLPYKGPDVKFTGQEVCYGYNEDTLTIYNVTDKAKATIISRTSYVGASYTHQGWVLDPENQHYLLLDDELDEVDEAGLAADGFPVTYIWDISNLAAPKLTGHYKTSVKGIDHNQYVSNGLVYQSNYGAGLRILDVSGIPLDPTGGNVKELGFFDIYPEDDDAEGGGEVEFQGTWSSYGFFKSGYIVINTIERGAFVVKLADGAQ